MIKNLKFKSAGHFSTKEKWRHPRPAVSSWEMIYMIEGEAHLFEGEDRFSVSAGDAVLLSSGVEHGGFEFSYSPTSFFWVHVTADGEASSALSELPRIMRSADMTQIPVLARQLLHRANHPAYTSEIKDLAATLLFSEYEVFAVENADGGDNLVNGIREWVRINSEKPLRVADIADELGYNVDYLSRVFKARTGISIKLFINNMRMNFLRNQLLSTDLPLKRIASDFGFEDYKSFLKFFTYHEGMTPTEFRESCYMTYKNNR